MGLIQRLYCIFIIVSPALWWVNHMTISMPEELPSWGVLSLYAASESDSLSTVELCLIRIQYQNSFGSLC